MITTESRAMVMVLEITIIEKKIWPLDAFSYQTILVTDGSRKSVTGGGRAIRSVNDVA